MNGARARRAGVSNRDVAVSLQTVLSGIETTQYREDDKIIPVTLRSVSADREDLGKIEGLNVYSQVTGQSVPLRQVADLEVVWQPSKILRLEAAQRRLRPILLTTATTVGGLLPLWLGGGPMWEPMVIAIIFGLVFATALTLGFVPILYSLFYRVSFGT